MKLLQAKVINNNDIDKKAKIKIKLLVEHKDALDSSLPWIKPLFGADTSDKVTFNIPEVDSIIPVLMLDDYYLELRYIPEKYYFKGNADYTVFNAPNDIDSQTYPQPMFTLFKDGSIDFRNTETGESGQVHANGQYILFDKDGNIFIYSKDKSIKLYNDSVEFTLDKDTKKIDLKSGDAELILDGNTNTFELKDSGNSIKSSATSVTINNNFQVLI